MAESVAFVFPLDQQDVDVSQSKQRRNDRRDADAPHPWTRI